MCLTRFSDDEKKFPQNFWRKSAIKLTSDFQSPKWHDFVLILDWLLLVLNYHCPFRVWVSVFAMDQPKLGNAEKFEFRFQVIFGINLKEIEIGGYQSVYSPNFIIP